MKRTAVLLLMTSFACAQELPDRITGDTPAETQLALLSDAAPPDVVANATVFVLRKHGYEKYRQGTNGFSCLVLREYRESLEPECYDAVGSKSTLLADLFLEAQRARGRADEAIRKDIAAGYKSGRFKAPKGPGIVYMLSTHNRVFDPDSKKVISFPGHLMFYAPYATAQTVGGGKGAPYIVSPGEPTALLIVVPAARE